MCEDPAWLALYGRNCKQIFIDGQIHDRGARALPDASLVVYYMCHFSGDPDARPGILINADNVQIWPGEVLICKPKAVSPLTAADADKFDGAAMIAAIRAQAAYFGAENLLPAFEAYIQSFEELLRAAPEEKKAGIRACILTVAREREGAVVQPSQCETATSD